MDSRTKKKEKKNQYQDGGLVEQYKMKMNWGSTLEDFMSLKKRIPLQKQWRIELNLKPPDRIRADRSISDGTIAALKDNGLPL